MQTGAGPTERWLTARALAWAIFDFATSVWTVCVIARYFPIWLKELQGGQDFHIAIANSLSLAVAGALELMLTPLSDATGRRRIFVTVFTLVTAFCTLVLGAPQPLLASLALYGLANLSLNIAITFYNAMLRDVSTARTIDRVSALGVGLAELGIIAGLVVLSRVGGARSYTGVFASTAMILVALSLPLMLVVRERGNGPRMSYREARQRAWSDLVRLVRYVLGNRRLRLFLFSYVFSGAAIAAIVLFMALYAKQVVGLSEEHRIWGVDELSFYMLVGTVVSVFGAFVAGEVATRVGQFPSLVGAVLVWCAALTIAALAQSKWLFWVAGMLTGLAFSAGRVLVRAVLLESVGPEDTSKIFGLAGLAHKVSAAIGYFTWSAVVAVAALAGLAKYRVAMGSLAVLALISLIFLVAAMRSDGSGAGGKPEFGT